MTSTATTTKATTTFCFNGLWNATSITPCDSCNKPKHIRTRDITSLLYMMREFVGEFRPRCQERTRGNGLPNSVNCWPLYAPSLGHGPIRSCFIKFPVYAPRSDTQKVLEDDMNLKFFEIVLSTRRRTCAIEFYTYTTIRKRNEYLGNTGM